MTKVKPVVVVMPAYNPGECLKLTIDSLFKSTKHPFKLIIVESESTDGTAKCCDEYAKKNKRIEVIHTKKEGVTKAVNTGIRAAGDSDVFLTQCDVIFPKQYSDDWLSDMAEASKVERCGVITCHGGGGVSGPDYLEGFSWVGTWCMYIPRRTINEVGIFDEETFCGPGDDIDYSYRLYLAKKVIFVINYWVDHHRQQDYQVNDPKQKYVPIQKANGELFKKKYGLYNQSEFIKFYGGNLSIVLKKSTLIDGGHKIGKLNILEEGKEVYDTIIKVLQLFNDDDIYIDVGAGIGETSVWSEKGTCYAFEPGRNYEHLLTNINLNPRSKVISINAAVYSKPIHYETIEKEHFGLDEIRETKDKSKPQAIVLDEKFKGVKNIKLIKIDAEGSDLEVLKGAVEIIKKNRPIIIIEVSHVDVSKIVKILLDLDYDLSTSRGENCIAIPNEVKK